jgi:hypothetical protein
MDALNGEGLEDPALIQDALDNSQGQLRVDRGRDIKNDRSQQAILWAVEQSMKTDKLQDAISALHVEDLIPDPTLVARLCELTPEMPYLLFEQALIPVVRRNNVSLSARHIEALIKLVDLYRENQELLTKAILEGKEIDETAEVLLGLALDDEHTMKLVTYGIQTIGVEAGTLAWAARRAGNLEGGPKVKLARRSTTPEGRSVS